MKKYAAIFMALVLVTGFSAAVVGEDTPEEGPSITDTGPDQAPEEADTGMPENVSKGPVGKAKGLATAASKVPADVSNAVIQPLQNGVTSLGNMFDLGSLLGSQPENVTENQTDVEE